MDLRWFAALNRLAGRWHSFDALVRLVAKDAIVLVPLALVLAWILPGDDRVRGRSAVVLGAFALLAALGVNQLLGRVVNRERPFVHHHVTQLIPHAKDHSFPSDHTAATFGAAAGLWVTRKRIGAALAVVGVAVGLARVIAGVHYPGDVAGGAAIGIASALALWLVLRQPLVFITRVADRRYEALVSPFRTKRAA